MGPFHFRARDCKRRPNLALVFLCVYLCCRVFCCGCLFAFVVLDLVFQYLAMRLAEKNISEMTYFVSGGM